MIYVRIAIELAATAAENLGLTNRRAALVVSASLSAVLVVATIWAFGLLSRDTGAVASGEPPAPTTVAEAAPFAPVSTVVSGNRAQVVAGTTATDAGGASNSVSSGNPGRAETIRSIQNALRHAGCYDGAANGYWSSKTRDGMRRLLVVLNAPLPVDQPDPALAALLASNPAARCDGTVGRPMSQTQTAASRPGDAEAVVAASKPTDTSAVLASVAAGAAVAAAGSAVASRPDETAADDRRERRRASVDRDEPTKPAKRTSRRRTANAFDGVSRNMNRNFRSLSRSLSSLFR